MTMMTMVQRTHVEVTTRARLHEQMTLVGATYYYWYNYQYEYYDRYEH